MLSVVLSIFLSIFTPPVDYDISLAGNFGEPRPNHFHGGLDIRTDGVEGKHVYAIADGYVSRITVGLDGFGNAVYVTHPTGHTSIYCHLKAFSPRIRAALRRYQYRHSTSVADARLSPLEVPVAQGQFIALSGNTGHSTAPHLHLEVHDSRTWDMLDPYELLNDFITDSVAPRAHGLMACPQPGQGVFNGGTARQTFGFDAHQLSRRFTAWGRVGFALWGDDYMEGSSNHYGIRETILMVDGHEMFHSVVDRVPVGLNRMVNSWGDYDHFRQHHNWYLKSFVEPGNTLPILHTDDSRGIIDFCEEREYHLEYVLRDYKGNESRYTFTVVGEPQALPPVSHAAVGCTLLRWNRTCSYSLPGMQLVVPYGMLANDAVICPAVYRQADGYSDAYSYASASLPLMAVAELSIHARRVVSDEVVDTFDPSKLYLANENGRFMGGDYHDGWVTGFIRDLGGRYEVAYDDQPPVVRLLGNPESPVAGSQLRLTVTDALSGIASWRGTVDDRFVVFDAIEKSSTFACSLPESWLRRTGKLHRLRFEVTDNRDNTTIFETKFVY